MASVSHYVEYLAVSLGAWKAKLLSARMADRYGAFLGTLAWHLWSSRRKVTLDNLKNSFGNTRSADELRRIGKEVFRNTGRTVVEIARFEKLGIEGARRIVHVDRPELFARLHAEGKGGILLSAHFGNWEMIPSVVRICGDFTIEGVVAHQSNPMVDRRIRKIRLTFNHSLIMTDRAVPQMMRALRAGHFVAMAADQHAAASGALRLTFLGREAAVARGPALIAIRTKAPLIPILLRRERYDRHVVIMEEPIYPDPTRSEDENVVGMTERYLRFLEEQITKYPEQWLWSHRRWKV